MNSCRSDFHRKCHLLSFYSRFNEQCSSFVFCRDVISCVCCFLFFHFFSFLLLFSGVVFVVRERSKCSIEYWQNFIDARTIHISQQQLPICFRVSIGTGVSSWATAVSNKLFLPLFAIAIFIVDYGTYKAMLYGAWWFIFQTTAHSDFNGRLTQVYRKSTLEICITYFARNKLMPDISFVVVVFCSFFLSK